MSMSAEPDLTPPVNRLKGALYGVVAALMFAAMGATIKQVSGQVSHELVVFFRCFFGLLALIPVLIYNGFTQLKTTHLSGHVWRTVAGIAAAYCFFFALANMPLAEAVLFNFTAPLFIPFVAYFWLKERVGWSVRVAILVGFVGVTLILKPGAGAFTPAAIIGLASGLLAAVAVANIRRMARTEPTLRIVFYFSLIGTLISVIPLAWIWQTPPRAVWGLLVLMGVFATAGQLLLTHAYTQAPAATVGPYTYTAVIFAAAFGWLLWDEQPDAWSLLGTLLVCAAGILAMRGGGWRAVKKPPPIGVSPL